MGNTTSTWVAGLCLALIGCGKSGETTGGTGGTSTTTSGGSSSSGSSSSSSSGSGGTGGGAMCAEMPISPLPWSPFDCASQLSVVANGTIVSRIPGWKLPIALNQAMMLAEPTPDATHACSLDTNFTAQVAVGGASPPVDPAKWTKVTFNPQIPAGPSQGMTVPTSFDFPVQTVSPGENLYVAVDVKGEQGTLCFGLCDQHDGWTWGGASVSALQPVPFQMEAWARGKVKLDCAPVLRNNVEECADSDQGNLTAATSEEGDLAVERLIPPGPATVRTIVFEVGQGGPCVLPDQLDLLYWTGDAAAPSGSTWTEVKVSKDEAYRIGDARVVFAVDVSPPLAVPAGQALYAGLRLHAAPTPLCIETCGGDGAADGQAWWGHTHLTPGEVVFKSLASEGFVRSYRIAAIYDPK